MPPAALSCPSCHGLVHADRLKALAARAGEAQASGDVSAQLEAWRLALALLPPASSQHQAIAGRVEALSRTLSDPDAARPPVPEAAGGRTGIRRL